MDVYDPWVDKDAAKHEYGITLLSKIDKNKYDAIILAVAHSEFTNLGADTLHEFGKEAHVLYDLKYILSADQVDGRL